MYQPRTPGFTKRDPLKRWSVPDRVFFACGSCHILAHAFLERYGEAGHADHLDQAGARLLGQPHLRRHRRLGVRLPRLFPARRLPGACLEGIAAAVARLGRDPGDAATRRADFRSAVARDRRPVAGRAGTIPLRPFAARPFLPRSFSCAGSHCAILSGNGDDQAQAGNTRQEELPGCQGRRRVPQAAPRRRRTAAATGIARDGHRRRAVLRCGWRSVVAIFAALGGAAFGIWSLRPVPAYSSNRVKVGSAFGATFWVENVSAWFPLSHLKIHCALTKLETPDMVAADQSRIPDRLEPGQSATFTCPFPAADLDVALRSEIYFRSEYDAARAELVPAQPTMAVRSSSTPGFCRRAGRPNPARTRGRA